ncbi:GNAT family protein [Nocardioides convexus]|uniref:GNAT family N-acetyltransferase n=1 Tax=Nocardioides convexus TaxID=2712224 RepID=UPI002418821C|nr:GNAT family protein [Nocardioides convexus]
MDTTGTRGSAPGVRLRPVEDADLDTLFQHQTDPEASAMAAFPARGRDDFDQHWARLRADDSVVTRTIVADGAVAGQIGRLGAGRTAVCSATGSVASGGAVASPRGRWLSSRTSLTVRPLMAHVAVHNRGSIRVLEKCGFRRDRAQEAAAPEDGVEELVFVLER